MAAAWRISCSAATARRQGRWISPDPAGLKAVNPANPQSWNRYAYVVNNPLGLTDSTGLTYEGHLTCPELGISNAGMPCKTLSDSPGQYGVGGEDEFDALISNGCDEECRHESIISTGWDPELGIDRSTVQYSFANVNNGYDSITERQLETAAIQLGKSACDGQGSNAIAGCIQNAYDAIGVSVDSSGRCNGLVGGNCNFNYLGVVIQGQALNPESLAGCSGFGGGDTRCGIFDSLHFHTQQSSATYGTFHVDTANPYFVPIGSFVHLGFDVIGGNTWWSGGIPRPWWQ